jgi:hypothetical protein
VGEAHPLHPRRCRPHALSPSPPLRPIAQDEEGVRADGRDEEEVEPERRKEHWSHRRTPTCVHRLKPLLVGRRLLL